MAKAILRQRMYHLTLYNISEIQKGIQSYHAGIEYYLHYGKSKEFINWAKKEKTVIILNGGTTNDSGRTKYKDELHSGTGTMQKYLIELQKQKINTAEFYEPDLNNAMTAISFLVDERVWDKEKYPEVKSLDDEAYYRIFNKNEYEKRMAECKRKGIMYITADTHRLRLLTKEEILQHDIELYGPQVGFLRTWLKQFKLA